MCHCICHRTYIVAYFIIRFAFLWKKLQHLTIKHCCALDSMRSYIGSLRLKCVRTTYDRTRFFLSKKGIPLFCDKLINYHPIQIPASLLVTTYHLQIQYE